MLNDLQALLSRINGIEHKLDVLDFLITDAGLARAIETDADPREAPEKVLLHEADGELGVSLYLDEALLSRLDASDPCLQLGHENLADFWTVLEGVSHFNYIVWNASVDKPVTLLELELQAEVDKYAAARFLAELQGSPIMADVWERLFAVSRFDENLQPGELSRYRYASAFAGNFCRSLERRFPAARESSGMLDELQAFFRLPQPDKVGHIRSAAFA